MFKIKVKKGYEPEDVLEKALKSLRGQRRNKLEDPYLRQLYNHAMTLYDLITEAMIEDLLDLFYPDQKLSKSKKDLVEIEVDVHGRNGSYKAKRWVNPNKGLEEVKKQIKAVIGEEREFILQNKKTGKEESDQELLEAYKKNGLDQSLTDFIKKRYSIIPKKIDAKADKHYTIYSKRKLKSLWYKAREDGRIYQSTSKDKFLKIAKEYEEMVGEKTSDGHTIEGYVPHVIERTIGTNKDPKTGKQRMGLASRDVLDALKTVQPEISKKNKNRKIYKTSKALVVFDFKANKIITVIRQ